MDDLEQYRNFTEDDEFEKVDAEMEDSESSPAEYEISTYPADFTLEVLANKWNRGDIIIPDFQREFVWSVFQSSRLIESFMMGLPVPPIFFYVDKKTNKNLVIDGQQRLKSIFYFMGAKGKNELEKREEKLLGYKLKGLAEKSRWYNKTFEEFSEEDKVLLGDCTLRAIIVKQLDPDDDTSVYHIFERLNTGGTLLNNQEVRNCVYSGPFNSCLHRLNRYDNWRKIFTKSESDNRQKDVELILRFFALHDNIKVYKKPMKEFLSKYMGNENIRFMKEDKIQEKERIFKLTVDAIIENLGSKPFHVRNGLNSSICDSVMLAFARNIESNGTIPADIKERYSKLCRDNEYYYYTSKTTNDPVSVLGRFYRALKYLFDMEE